MKSASSWIHTDTIPGDINKKQHIDKTFAKENLWKVWRMTVCYVNDRVNGDRETSIKSTSIYFRQSSTFGTIKIYTPATSVWWEWITSQEKTKKKSLCDVAILRRQRLLIWGNWTKQIAGVGIAGWYNNKTTKQLKNKTTTTITTIRNVLWRIRTTLSWLVKCFLDNGGWWMMRK